MKRVLKLTGLVVGGLVLVVAVVVAVLYVSGRSRLGTTYAMAAESVPINTDSATLTRGEHLVDHVIACGECHGERLGGEAFFQNPALGTVVSANLTQGEGSVVTGYTDEDWIRAIRHAVGRDSTPLLVMPSMRFINMSAEDLGAVVSYMKAVPPVDNTPPSTDLKPMAFIMTAAGQLDELIPAEYIEHDSPLPEAPPEGPTAEYGRYLVDIGTCRDCHGEELAGGQAGPGEPIGPNITPYGRIGDWERSDFVRLLRTGEMPSGREAIDFMPWRFYRGMTDVELEAIWAYLQSLEPVETPAEFARR